MQDLYTTIEKTALAFVSSVGDENHESYLAPNFERNYGPLQLEIPEKNTHLADLDNLNYSNHFQIELTKFSIESDKRLLDSSIDPKKRKAWLWYQLELEGAAESLGSPFDKVVLEVMWLLDLTEDGKKVVRCRQYLDTVGCDAFFPDAAEAAQAALEREQLQGRNEQQQQQDPVRALTDIDEEKEGGKNGIESILKGLSISRS